MAQHTQHTQHIGKVVHVTPESHPGMFGIMQEMNQREAKEIKQNNQAMIDTLSKGLTDAKDLESKIKLLCNATANIFDKQRQWFFANEKHVALMKDAIQSHWKQLIQDQEKESVRSTRNNMAKRPILNVPDSEKQWLEQYWKYVDSLLPI